MIKLLVPIEQLSWVALSAAYFALEFAKRNPAKILFLLLPPGSGGDRKAAAGEKSKREWEQRFTDLVQRGRTEKITLELHHTQAPFLAAVTQFAREHPVSDIIVAVPPPQDDAHIKTARMIKRLRHQIDCQIITVKPKEEAWMSG